MSAENIANFVSVETGIGILKVYEEEDQQDGGFNWSVDDIDYQVQIAGYNRKPFLLHKNLPDGSIQMVAACSTVSALCIEIKALLTN